MNSGFDEFLRELRGQIVRAADEQAAPERAARRRPVREGRVFGLAPRRAMAWAAVLAVGTAALVGGFLALRSDDRSSYSTSGLASSPGSQYPAAVRPVTPFPAGSPSTMPGATLGSGYGLAAIAATGASDVWAVGKRVDRAAQSAGPDGAATTDHSFILHFDGASWRETPSPDVGPLTSVAAASPGDAWALSATGDILHWGGGAWTAVQSPVTNGVVALRGLGAVAGGLWAVGSRDGSPLVLQWDGAVWHVADLPRAPSGGGALTAVSGSAAGDVWAVGHDAKGGLPLVLHWDGVQWSYVVDDAEGGGGLLAVAAAAPNDVWAGGGDSLEHWDGSEWLSVPETFGGVHGSIVALSSGDVWACGAAGPLRWDRQSWQPITAEQMGLPAQTAVGVAALAATSPSDVWAAGTISSPQTAGQRPLVAHWDGSRWNIAVDSVQTQ